MMRKLASMLIIGAIWCPGLANALGLGELTLKSYLNEPLHAEVELLELGELDTSQVKVRLATREDFSRAGVERDYFLTSLRFVVQPDGGGGKLVITSTLPVREPYLNFIVEARWPTGRLLREYTVLLDPPVFVGSEQGITARASSEQRRPPSREPERPGERSREPGLSSTRRAEPSRSFGAGATDSPISGEEYLVRRDDTLWRIAEQARPAGASVQQTMLDIQRLNPEAFIGGNINRLKSGYVLRMPTADQITQQSFEQAIAEVASHDERWQRGASDVESRFDASRSTDYGSSDDSGQGEGHLQIAAADDADAQAGGEISARMEDLERSRRETADLTARLGSLEQQLRMQERLISLKDEQIAAMQDALARAGEESPELVAGQQETGAIEAGPDTAMDDTAQDADMPGAGVVEGTVTDAAPETGETAATDPQPEESRPTPAPSRPSPSPSLIDTLMGYIHYIGAGLLILLLAVVYFLRNRLPGLKSGGDQPVPARPRADDEDEFAGVSLSDDSLIVDEFAEDAEGESAAADTMGGFSAPDEEAYAAQFETGDALAEADIYIAYGRFPQAVDLLKTAISVEPVNTDYRMKLMEACVEMVDREEFQQQYSDLQLIGDEHVLARARDLLEAVDGGEVWLEDLPAPTLSQDDVATAKAATEAHAGEMASVDLGLDEGDETAGLEADPDLDSLDLDLDEKEQDNGEPGPIEYKVDREGELAVEGLDEQEALDEASAGEIPEDIAEELADELQEGGGLELDEELAGPGAWDEGTGFELPDLEIDSRASAGDVGDEEPEHGLLDGTGELDLDLEGVEPAVGEVEEASLDSLDISLDDDEGEDLFDLSEELDEIGEQQTLDSEKEFELADFDDLDDASLSLEPAGEELASGDLDIESVAPADSASEGMLDFGDESELDGAEFSLDELGSDEDLESMELDMSAEDADDEDESIVYAVDGDEVATKLDLARAYLDMGDHEGARNILGEVIEEGSETQQSEATSLLEGID